MFATFKLTLIIRCIGLCQSALLWLQSKRYALIEAQLDILEKK